MAISGRKERGRRKEMRRRGKIQLMAKGGETGERILEATEAAVRAIFIIVAMLACELVIIGACYVIFGR